MDEITYMKFISTEVTQFTLKEKLPQGFMQIEWMEMILEI